MTGHRPDRRTRGLLVLLALVAALLAPAQAGARTIDIGAAIEFEERPMAFDRCLLVVFVRWPDVPRATAYDIRLSDALYGTVVHHGGTPPLDDDDFQILGDPGVVFSMPAPGGRHQSVLGWGAGPGTFCAEGRTRNLARFAVVLAQAVLPDEQHRLSGTVRDMGGRPVAGASVTATSAGGASSATTGADGTYSMELVEDAYTVTASSRGRPSVPASTVVDLSADRSGVDFTVRAGFLVRGTIVACPPDSKQCPSPVAAPGVTVTASGAGSGQATTAADGGWTMELEPGAYTFTPSFQGTEFEPDSRRVTITGDTPGVDFRTCTTTLGKLEPCSSLQVVVDAGKKSLLVKQTAAGPVKRDVPVTVTLVNRGKRALYGVRLDGKLVVGYVDILGAKADSLPLRLEGKEKDVVIGQLRPGAWKTVTLPYVARGDGDLSLTAVAHYAMAPKAATQDATGETTLQLRTKLLWLSLRQDRVVRSPNTKALIQAGTAFSVRVKLENRSFVKRLVVVAPVLPKGNAHGGHWQDPGRPIQVTDFTRVGADPPSVPKVVVLEPNTTREYDVVYMSLASDPRKMGQRNLGGGTRASLSFAGPYVFVDPVGTEATDLVPAASTDVVVDPTRRTVQLSVDDLAKETVPYDASVAFMNYSIGLVQGVWTWNAASLRSVGWLLTELPPMLVGGSLEIPGMVRNFMVYQRDVWSAVQRDPALRAEFSAQVRAYVEQNMSDLVAADVKLVDAIDASVQQHYKEMWDEVYAGDWQAGARALGVDSSERALDVATAISPEIGPALLMKLPAVQRSLTAMRSGLWRVAVEALEAIPKRPTAAMVVRVMGSDPVAYGLELTPALRRQLLGWNEAQVAWMDNVWNASPQSKKYLLTFKGRSFDAVRYDRAFFKPEFIKIKSVDWIDVEFLGYRYDDLSRLVVKRPPAPGSLEETRLIRAWEARGATAGTRMRKDAIARLRTRQKEWFDETAGEALYADLRAWSDNGNVVPAEHANFNWDGNTVNPYADPVPNGPAGIKLEQRPARRDPMTGRTVEEYDVLVDPRRVGDYQPVVSDVDLLGLTHLDGSPLTDAEHIEVINMLRQSPFQVASAETGSWTNAAGDYTHAKKMKILRGGIQGQAGPDGKVRLVRFDERASLPFMLSNTNSRLFFEGGWMAP